MLEFGDSLDETGNIKKTSNNSLPVPNNNGCVNNNNSNAPVPCIYTTHKWTTKGNNNAYTEHKFDDNEPEGFKYQLTVFS